MCLINVAVKMESHKYVVTKHISKIFQDVFPPRLGLTVFGYDLGKFAVWLNTYKCNGH